MLVLLACGALGRRGRARRLAGARRRLGGGGSGRGSRFKVGALSYGGGFVIIPLMQDDAVDSYRWMTDGQFLNAVALGQVTPGPVVHTVAAVGYAAAGVGGALLAAAVAFAPSFSSSCSAARASMRCARTRPSAPSSTAPGRRRSARSWAPAIPLALALRQPWQGAVLAAAFVALVVLRRGIVVTLIAAGLAGTVLG